MCLFNETFKTGTTFLLGNDVYNCKQVGIKKIIIKILTEVCRANFKASLPNKK